MNISAQNCRRDPTKNSQFRITINMHTYVRNKCFVCIIDPFVNISINCITHTMSFVSWSQEKSFN